MAENMKDPNNRIVYSRIQAEFFCRHNEVFVSQCHFFVLNKYTQELLERIPFPYTPEELGDLDDEASR